MTEHIDKALPHRRPAKLHIPRTPEPIQRPIALHFAHYNFCRVRQMRRVTPAMEARLTDHVWTLEELVSLLDRRNAEAA